MKRFRRFLKRLLMALGLLGQAFKPNGRINQNRQAQMFDMTEKRHERQRETEILPPL